MDNEVGSKLFDNFRENALLVAVFYVLLPTPVTCPTGTNIIWLIIAYLLFAGLLWRTEESIRKEKKLFLQDKVLFITTLCIEGICMALKPFVTIPDIVEWVGIIWGLLLVVLGFVWMYLYPVWEKKGKWKHPMTVQELTYYTLSNYFSMAAAFLMIMKWIHIG